MAKRNKTTESDPPALVTTHAALAEAVGVERSTITKRLKRDDCPVSAAGPWDADDVAAIVDWVHAADDPHGGDDLKRAQALKARVLAARYLQQMSADLGRLGNAEGTLVMSALSATTTLHWQHCRHGLGDLLREVGGLEPVEADRQAEDFARGFYDAWNRIFLDQIARHAVERDDLTPIVRRIRGLAAELEVMPDIEPEMIREITRPLDELVAGSEVTL